MNDEPTTPNSAAKIAPMGGLVSEPTRASEIHATALKATESPVTTAFVGLYEEIAQLERIVDILGNRLIDVRNGDGTPPAEVQEEQPPKSSVRQAADVAKMKIHNVRRLLSQYIDEIEV